MAAEAVLLFEDRNGFRPEMPAQAKSCTKTGNSAADDCNA